MTCYLKHPRPEPMSEEFLALLFLLGPFALLAYVAWWIWRSRVRHTSPFGAAVLFTVGVNSCLDPALIPHGHELLIRGDFLPTGRAYIHLRHQRGSFVLAFFHRARAALRASARRSSRLTLRHRERAALLALAFRSMGVSAFLRALPPWLANQRAYSACGFERGTVASVARNVWRSVRRNLIHASKQARIDNLPGV